MLLDNLGSPIEGAKFLAYTHRHSADIEGLRKQGWIIKSKMNLVTNIADYTLLSPYRARANTTVEAKIETMSGLVRHWLAEHFGRLVKENDPTLVGLIEGLWSVSHKANTNISKWTDERLKMQGRLWKVLQRGGHSPHYVDFDGKGEWVLCYQSGTTGSLRVHRFHESRLEKKN